jgi:hypothetical protein
MSADAPELAALTIDEVEWSKLSHAYGRAHDTPAHLRALLDGDAAAKRGALDHLWSAVLHQGDAFPVTAVVAQVLVGLAPDPRLDDVRTPMWDFLGRVVEVLGDALEAQGMESTDGLLVLADAGAAELDRLIAAGDDDSICEDVAIANAQHARSVLACAAVSPLIVRQAWRELDNVASHARVAAATTCASAPQFLPGNLAERLAALVESARGPEERDAMSRLLAAELEAERYDG